MMIPDRDKAHLFEPFSRLLIQFERRLGELKLPFRLFEGFRSWDRQQDLWDQGRASFGTIVTKSRPGTSFHQYGLAADYVLYVPGRGWSWDTKDEPWQEMADVAIAFGLEAGYYWQHFPDLPHLQKTYGLTIGEAMEWYKKGGLPAVWEQATMAFK